MPLLNHELGVSKLKIRERRLFAAMSHTEAGCLVKMQRLFE